MAAGADAAAAGVPAPEAEPAAGQRPAALLPQALAAGPQDGGRRQRHPGGMAGRRGRRFDLIVSENPVQVGLGYPRRKLFVTMTLLEITVEIEDVNILQGKILTKNTVRNKRLNIYKYQAKMYKTCNTSINQSINQCIV